MSDSTYIDKELKLRGLLKAQGQLVVIAGRFEGEIEAKDIIIEEGAFVQGFMRAETISIAGRFTGILETDSLIVSDAGMVGGEILTQSLAVDSGADISGTVTRKAPKELQKTAS